MAQLEALDYLASCNRYSDTPAATGAFLGITKGTTSQTLRALEDKGLITKTPDANDARVVHCRPTRKGRTLARSILPPEILRDVDSPTLEAELEGLLRQLQRSSGNVAFGVCHSCEKFTREAQGYRCGLTGERLTELDSTKLCREYEAPRLRVVD
jgi:DNA-binding MarR family transcriptional regulator